jgi:nucleotide-binding universal stress UspA family protein
MKKVLIAIDYSPCSQIIAETGYALAMAMDAEICITYVIADIAYYSLECASVMGFEEFSSDACFRKPEEQEKVADDFLAAVVRHLDDSRIKTKVLDGRTANAILAFAAEWNAALIVVGAQSQHGFEKLLSGDVVPHVLKHAAIPVVVVPTEERHFYHTGSEEHIHQYM